MNAGAALALLPVLVLSGAAVLAMLAVAVRRSHALTAAIAVLGLAASFASLWPAASVAPQRVTTLLVVDGYSLFYFGLLIAAALAIAVLAFGYLEKQEGNREELYVLLLVATLGALVLVATFYALRLVRRAFQGPNVHDWRIADLTPREALVFAPLVLVLLWLGLYPRPLLRSFEASMVGLQQRAAAAAQAPPR